jgi:hypothetical protein
MLFAQILMASSLNCLTTEVYEAGFHLCTNLREYERLVFLRKRSWSCVKPIFRMGTAFLRGLGANARAGGTRV